jgi:CelD/BcsL family acetyltransferase involved in cellulose biosynthesis
MRRPEDAVPARTWANAAYARRRAARECGVTVTEATRETLDADLDVLETLHAARWKARGGDGMLATPHLRAFHREAARALLGCGMLALFTVRFGGRPAGSLHCLRDRHATRNYLGGFDPAQSRRSPGAILIAHAIADAHRRGHAAFDFLRGAEPYKYAWGARDRMQVLRCAFARSGHALDAAAISG